MQPDEYFDVVQQIFQEITKTSNTVQQENPVIAQIRRFYQQNAEFVKEKSPEQKQAIWHVVVSYAIAGLYNQVDERAVMLKIKQFENTGGEGLRELSQSIVFDCVQLSSVRSLLIRNIQANEKALQMNVDESVEKNVERFEAFNVWKILGISQRFFKQQFSLSLLNKSFEKHLIQNETV